MKRAITALVFAMISCSGCASLGTYMKDRTLDLADCFKADIGLLGVGLEAHMRVTDAVVTGVGTGFAVKTGFKGRHLRVWSDGHNGLPLSCLNWFSREKEVHGFPVTYWGLVGNSHPFCSHIIGMQGSFEAESILFWPIWFEKEPRKFEYIPDAPKPIEYWCSPVGHPFEKDLINSFDIEVGATAGLLIAPSAHLGVSPGQFLDFLLGWFGIDI